MSRARRAELQRRAREIRLACQRRGMTVEQVCGEILAELPDMLPLEAWRLAYGWSRTQAIDGIAGLYTAQGMERPPLTPGKLCKWEHGQEHPGPDYGPVLCHLYGVSPAQLGLQNRKHRASPLRPPAPVVTVGADASDDENGDPMRRRTLIAAAGLSVPLYLLERLDDALAAPGDPGRPEGPAEIQRRLQAARRQFDTSALAVLLAGMPVLLAAAEDTAERVNTPGAWGLLAGAYALATDALNKVGRLSTARITADRGMLYARQCGDPVAVGVAARPQGMMLRKDGRHGVASQVVLRAADQLEAAGLRTPAQAANWIRLRCAAAYTASWAGDRDRALEAIGEVERVAAPLATLTGPMTAMPFVTLYRSNICFALGDAGTALHVARNLRPEMYPTPERRGRLFTDMARYWDMWGKPEETARALLAAHAEAPGEVEDRPSIRRIAASLAVHHPRVSGVQELTAALSRA